MTTQITTASQLADAIWGLTDGDNLQLVGSFPATRAKRNPAALTPASVTLDCTAATFTGQQYWTGLATVSLSFSGGMFGEGAGLRISGFGQLAVTKATFDGGGIMADHGGSVSISGTAFKSSGCGISIAGSKGVSIINNTFAAMIGDCINLPGCQDATVSRNRCEGGAPGALAHPDFLQAWALTGGLAMTGWVIEDNYVKGPTQGLFLPDGVIGVARRNHLETGFANAIAVGSGTVLLLEANTVLTLAGAKDAARIATYPGGTVTYGAGNSVNGQPVVAPPAAAPPPSAPPSPPSADPRDAQIGALKAKIAAATAALAD